MAVTPIEPPASPWDFPDTSAADEYGVVALGADLEPGTLLAAYRRGIFPMPIDGTSHMAWWSPDPRGVLELSELRVSRSLRRSCRRYRVSFNADFPQVMRRCADPGRDGGWITEDIITAYSTLHRLGWAHSVEVWEEDELVGGLYGVGIGGLFCGESMFHTARDASKVALVALVEELTANGAGLVDVQWETEHLATLGVTAIDRDDYRRRVQDLVNQPHTAALGAR